MDGPFPSFTWLGSSSRVAPGGEKNKTEGMEIVKSLKGLCFPFFILKSAKQKLFIASFRHLLVDI